MVSSPRSPSPFVPGAWPASPSPKRQRSPEDLHYLRSRQHSPDSHYRKIVPGRGIPSLPITMINPATSASADNTSTSFASDVLSLHSSPANTSFSSAYTNTSPSKFLFTPRKFTKLKDEIKSEPLRQDTCNTKQQSPDDSVCKHCDMSKFLGTDQTCLSLPEIPDLSSLSSLRDEFRISRDQFNVSSNTPVSYLGLDQSFLELQLDSDLKHSSLETLSSSSIQFRRTEVVRSDPLELDAEPLCFPQPGGGRNSWTLFSSPKSGHSGGPSFSQARNSLTLATSESGCKSAGSTFAHVRRSWRVGNTLPPVFSLGHEKTSTGRYANDVLDHAFNIRDEESSLALGVSCTNSSVHGHVQPNSSLGSRLPFITGPRPQTTFLLAMERMKKRVQSLFAKLKTKANRAAGSENNAPDILPSHSSLQDIVRQNDTRRQSIIQTPRAKRNGLKTQSVRITGVQRYNDREIVRALELRPQNGRTQPVARPLSLPSHPVAHFSHRSRHVGKLPNDASGTRLRAASEIQQHLHREASQVQEDDSKSRRRSFLSCIGAQ